MTPTKKKTDKYMERQNKTAHSKRQKQKQKRVDTDMALWLKSSEKKFQNAVIQGLCQRLHFLKRRQTAFRVGNILTFTSKLSK